MNKLERILCVDDEPNILAAFRRHLREKYDLEVVTSPEKAVELLNSKQRYAVIVSDMRMPGMDGASLLKIAREIRPETVRVMLTGNLDQETATQAINEGKIFRFLNKPCNSDQLDIVLREAVEYHNLITAEKDLLQNTLSGSIKVLTDILSLSDPIAFGAGARLRQPLRDICKELSITQYWEMELAAMLSVIGWVTIPDKIKNAYRSGEKLSAEEQKLIEKIPATSSALIKAIPRLAGVANIIEYSSVNFDGSGFSVNKLEGEELPLGARILHILNALLGLEAEGLNRHEALLTLSANPASYDSKIVERLLSGASKVNMTSLPVKFPIESSGICVGHRLMEDLFCLDGRLLLTAGTYVSEILRKSILNYADGVGLRTPIMVDSLTPINETKTIRR